MYLENCEGRATSFSRKAKSIWRRCGKAKTVKTIGIVRDTLKGNAGHCQSLLLCYAASVTVIDMFMEFVKRYVADCDVAVKMLQLQSSSHGM
jgi:hypothetical protein